MENKKKNKKLTIAQRYLFRAKWRNIERNSPVQWVYGCLSWREVQPSPIGGRDDKDYNLYKITCRQSNSMADWNLPFPTVTYWIPEEFYDTITPYSGWNDADGNNIFYEDVVRFYGEDGQYWDCWFTEFGILEPCSTEFQSVVGFCMFDADTRNIKDCKIIGNKWDGPRPGFEFQDWINWEGKNKEET